MLPVDRPASLSFETQTADIGRLTCEHELASALADLAGVDRRSPDVPEAIQRYARALWERLGQFPQCPDKVNTR